jgi:hypothetical protein
MTQPLTGVSWNSAGFNDRGPEFLRRGKAVAILSRDARGSATDLSPHNSDGSVRWSPFAQDNKWRDDLLAIKKVNGYFVTNTEDNQGFINLGPCKDGDGPARKPKITNDRFMILQSNQPYDTDLTEEVEPFSVTLVDTASPWVQRLRNNRPFQDFNGNLLVEDPGLKDAGFSRLLNGHNPGRQFLIVRERLWNGLPIYSADAVALAKLDDIGNSKMDKKDSEAAELTYLPVDDGFFMAMQDGEYQPILVHTFWGGAGWTALGGIPVLSATAPVATPGGSAGEATLAFAEPTGTGDPWNYEDAPAGVQQSTDAGVTWSALVAPDSVAVASGTVTLTLSGLTAGASVLRAVVQGSNGATATTPNSNSITVL